MIQCETTVKFHKGIGYHVTDVHEVAHHCQLEAGHEGHHVVSLPVYEDDEETGLSLPTPARPDPAAGATDQGRAHRVDPQRGDS